jgi:hypothetical protein
MSAIWVQFLYLPQRNRISITFWDSGYLFVANVQKMNWIDIHIAKFMVNLQS